MQSNRTDDDVMPRAAVGCTGEPVTNTFLV